MKRTVLIGGKNHGQPIELTDPPMPSLVMLDDPTNTGYTLILLRAPGLQNLELESRIFYVADGVGSDEATSLAQEHWPAGLLHEE